MNAKPEALTRRRLLGAGALGAGGLLLSGCDRLNASPGFRSLLTSAEAAAHGLAAPDRRSGAGARVCAKPDVAACSAPTATSIRRIPATASTAPPASPGGRSRSTAWSSARWRCRSPR